MQDDSALEESSGNRQPSPEIPPLPAASALSHQHPHLTDPSWTDPSDLLCSLLPASLSTVAQQLSAFDRQLTDELQAVVDAEHRDFIALASKLGGEKQRIDRLTYWAAAGPSPSTAISRTDPLTPSKGLEGIRRQVESEQIHIQQSQHDVQRLLHTKNQLDNRTAHLHLLLSFSDALQRIESLLGITSHTASVDTGYRLSNINGHPPSSDAQPHPDDDDDDDDDIQLIASSSSSPSDSGYSSDDSVTTTSRSTSKQTTSHLDLTPKRSLTHANGASSAGLRRGAGDLDLPTKIHRAKSSWEQLDFWTKAALAAVEPTSPDAVEHESPLLAYLTAHNHRVDAVRSAIKADCAHLFRILLQSGSLLIRTDPQEGMPTEPAATGDLAHWSQIDSQKYTDPEQLQSLRYQEQRTWLNLALQAWFRLDVDPSESSHQVRHILSSHTITPWATRYITTQRRASPEPQLHFHDVLLPLDNEPFKNSPFVHLFNDILTYVNSLTDVLSVLEDFDGSFSAAALSAAPSTSAPSAQATRPLRAFQLVVWDQIAAALTDQVGSQLFFVGRLEEFRANYQTTCAFLEALGKLAPSDIARRSWRLNPSYTSFMKRWQLSVYFQMRYRAIAGKLELELQSSSSPASLPTFTALPLLPASRGALEAFVSPWAPDGHLDALSPRQWKLSMLVVARFNVWLQASLPESLRRHGANSAGGAQSTAHNPTTQAPTRTATPDADAQSSDDEMLKHLSVLVADAMWFQNTLKTEFQQVISSKVGDAALSEQMKAALLACFSFEQDALPAISARITDLLKARSAEPLRLVRSVNTSSYRSSSSTTANTDATLPEASYFIPQFFRPLKSFFGISSTSTATKSSGAAAAQLVPQEIKVKWATQVVDDVAKKYAASLTQMIQNYESLKRLKRGGPSSTGSGGGFSGFATSWLGKTGASTANSTSQNASGASSEDPEAKRMQLQMRADVKRLEEDIADLAGVGVPIDLSSLESWQNLHKVIDGQKSA